MTARPLFAFSSVHDFDAPPCLGSMMHCFAAHVFSRRAQTKPLSEQQEVWFPWFSVLLPMFSQGRAITSPSAVEESMVVVIDGQ